jgi:O-antigen ligase
MLQVIQKIIALVIVLMPFFSPVFLEFTFFNVTPGNFKTVWGIFGVSVVTILWMYSQLKLSSIVIKKTKLYTPILAFIIWSFVSILWIEEGYLAIITLAKFVSYAVIFFIVINSFESFKSAEFILKLLVISMTLVSIIGLSQYYFYDNYFFQYIFSTNHPLGSTFGNRNMATHFIVMVFPVSIVYLLFSKSNKKITFYSLTIFISIWFIVFTMARQAYVSIALELFAIFAFILLDFYKHKGKSLLAQSELKLSKFIALIVIVISTIIVSNLTKDGWDFNGSEKLKRVVSITQEEGGNSRLPAWINTLHMVKDNPFLGVGVGQWQQSYAQYYDKSIKDVIYNEKTRLRTLHNEYLQMLSELGIVGYIFLLWLLYLTVSRIFHILTNYLHPYRVQVLAVSLGMLGFSVVAFFSFPIRVYLPAFLMMVYIAMIELMANDSSNNKFKKKVRKYQIKIIIILFFIAMVFVNKTSFSWLNAESHRQNAQFFEFDKMWKQTENAAMQSLRLNSWDWRAYSLAGFSKYKLGRGEEAIPYLKKSLDISPFNTIILRDLALIYHDTDNHEMEKKVLDFILRIDPKSVIASARLIHILKKEKLFDDLNIVYSNLKHNFEYFKNRSNFGPYHGDVSAAAIAIGDFKYAKYIYHDAIDRKEFNNGEAYVKLGTLEYYYFQNKKKGVEWFKKALKENPEISKNKEIKKVIENYELDVK